MDAMKFTEQQKIAIAKWIAENAQAYVKDESFDNQEEAIMYAIGDCLAETCEIYDDDDRYDKAYNIVKTDIETYIEGK